MAELEIPGFEVTNSIIRGPVSFSWCHKQTLQKRAHELGVLGRSDGHLCGFLASQHTVMSAHLPGRHQVDPGPSWVLPEKRHTRPSRIWTREGTEDPQTYTRHSCDTGFTSSRIIRWIMLDPCGPGQNTNLHPSIVMRLRWRNPVQFPYKTARCQVRQTLSFRDQIDVHLALICTAWTSQRIKPAGLVEI